MRITHIAAVAVIIAPLLLPQAVSQMTHEETVVRTTYARLSFAAQIEEIYKITNDAANNKTQIDRGEFATRLRDAGLSFELSDFKVGDLSEISQVKYSTLVTKPAGGDALDIQAGTWNLVSDEPRQTQSAIAVVRWHRQQNISEDWEQPFGVIHAQTEVAGQYSRYAAYKVKATFQNRSIDYRAMFLFGKDKAGQEIVLPIDTIVNLSGSSLNLFVKVPAYPGTLIEGGVGKDPVIYDWLMSNQRSSPSGKSHQLNCDLALLKCGVRSEDLKKLTRPTSGVCKISPPTGQAALPLGPKAAPAPVFASRPKKTRPKVCGSIVWISLRKRRQSNATTLVCAIPGALPSFAGASDA